MKDAILKFYLEYLEYPGTLLQYAQLHSLPLTECTYLIRLGTRLLSQEPLPQIAIVEAPESLAFA